MQQPIMLKIYNSFSKQKETLVPKVPGKISLYVCGITVYDYCHIGHARSFLVFDTVVRYLQYQGIDVTFIRNITDIDDKIIKRANENNEPIEILTHRFIQAMHEDMAILNLLPPTQEPRATDYILSMVNLIQTLLDKGYAYIGASGDVYYEVQKFKTYGCLAHRDLDDLKAGSRIEINDDKRNPLDFVLWKMAKLGEPHWPSPWGEGRPGWHIECSAMSLHLLGDTFDIHGGGQDLKFPHHENERAQSEGATDQKFVNIWMHAGFVQQSKEKMSKSLGNFLTIREYLKNNKPEVLRYFTIGSHYRSPVEYSEENMESSLRALERFYTSLRGLPDLSQVLVPENTEFEQRFCLAMDDDFNTPEALAVLFDLVREINRLREMHSAETLGYAALLKKLGNVLGLLTSSPETFLQGEQTTFHEVQEIEALIAQRDLARHNKEWAKADNIRKELTDRGITLEDTAGKTLWRRDSLVK